MAQTLKPAMIRLTEAMLCNALENNVGYCIVCGADHDGCEPDASRYRCDNCRSGSVYGAELCLLCDYIVIEEQETD